MQLLPREIARTLPPLYSQEEQGLAALVRVKFFLPTGSFTWYATEYDPKDRLFFGIVASSLCPEGELGNFSFDELQEARCPLGLGVERDLYWEPKSLSEVMQGLRS